MQICPKKNIKSYIDWVAYLKIVSNKECYDMTNAFRDNDTVRAIICFYMIFHSR